MTDLSIFETIGTNGAQAIGPPKDLVPAPSDAVRFDEIMGQTATDEIKIISGPSGMDTTQAKSQDDSASVANNVFFSKIDKLQSSTEKDFAEVVSILKSTEGKELEFKDVMRATIKMHNLTYRAHLSSKVAEKSNEAIQTLYKQQV